MENALLNQHVAHFRQAETIPMASQYLTNIFGKLAKTEYGQQFCQGTTGIDKLHTDIYTKEFLKKLQRKPSDPPEINTMKTATHLQNNYKTGKNVWAHPQRANT
eukprot:14497403-Ditylum_brightwellii.AAC.1